MSRSCPLGRPASESSLLRGAVATAPGELGADPRGGRSIVARLLDGSPGGRIVARAARDRACAAPSGPDKVERGRSAIGGGIMSKSSIFHALVMSLLIALSGSAASC